MSDQQQPLYKLQLNEGSGRSIFPTFNVNVPMPKGTAVPPQVTVVSPHTSASTAPTGTRTTKK